MHELSIAQSLIEVAEREAQRAGATQVTGLTCRVGALRQVDEVLLREAFEAARAGTLCRGCSLDIVKTDVQALCPRCLTRFPACDWEWHCPACGSEGEDPIGGDELEVLTIEAEVPDANRDPARHIAAQ